MRSPDEHAAKAEKILRRVNKARKAMDGRMVDPAHALQIQLATQVDVAIAQVHATLATRQPDAWFEAHPDDPRRSADA